MVVDAATVVIVKQSTEQAWGNMVVCCMAVSVYVLRDATQG